MSDAISSKSGGRQHFDDEFSTTMFGLQPISMSSVKQTIRSGLVSMSFGL